MHRFIQLFEAYVQDETKLRFAEQHWTLFRERCVSESQLLVAELMTGAYTSFDLDGVLVTITLDEIVTPSGGRSIGQYSDDAGELTLSLFPFIQGRVLDGIRSAEDLADLDAADRGLLEEALFSVFESNLIQIFERVFIHEIVHHFAAITYGEGYRRGAERLEQRREGILHPGKSERFYHNMPHEVDTEFISALRRTLQNHGAERANYGEFRDFWDIFSEYFRPARLEEPALRRVRNRALAYFENLP